MIQQVTVTGKVIENIQEGTIIESMQIYTPKSGDIQVKLAYILIINGSGDYVIGDLIYVEGRFISNKGYPPKDTQGMPVFKIKAATIRYLGPAGSEREDVFKAMVIGYLGRHPEKKFTSSGSYLVKTSIAANVNLGLDGKETTWFTLVQWNNEAMLSCKKRDFLLVQGNVEFDATTGGPPHWEGRQGDIMSNYGLSVYWTLNLRGSRLPQNGDLEAEEKEPEDIPF